MDRVEVVVAHDERATLRVGDVFLKVGGDRARLGAEVAAMAAAPVPTPEVLWHRPPVLALAALPGRPLGRLGGPSTPSPEAWAAAGAVMRTLHEAPLPVRRSPRFEDAAPQLDEACRWLLEHDTLPTALVTRSRQVAESVLRSWAPAHVHGDLQVDHVFVDDDVVTGVLDWSEAGQGPAMFDVASLTLGHEEHLDDVAVGYGEVDLEVVRRWWVLRSVCTIPWLLEHGFDPFLPGCEVDVLRANA